LVIIFQITISQHHFESFRVSRGYCENRKMPPDLDWPVISGEIFPKTGTAVDLVFHYLVGVFLRNIYSDSFFITGRLLQDLAEVSVIDVFSGYLIISQYSHDQ